MNTILYFFRDKIVSVPYFIYSFVILVLIFSIIGYLFKQKYAKVEIKLALTKQQNNQKEQIQTNEIPIDKKAAKKLAKLKTKEEKTKSLNSQTTSITSENVLRTQIKEDKKDLQNQNLNTQVYSPNVSIQENINIKEVPKNQINNQPITNQNVKSPANTSLNSNQTTTNLENNVEQKTPSTNITQPQPITLNTKIETSIPEIK